MVLSDFNEGENSYRRLAENLPGIVYRVLIEEDNRMIFFNDMVQTMTGYNLEDLKRGEVCSIDPLILPEDRLNVINIVKDAIENNVPFEVEYRINNKSGDVKWFSERGRPIKGDNGNPSYIDGVIYDITKRKEAEQKLKTSELNILNVNKYKILITGIVLGVLFWVIDAITDTLLFYSKRDLIQHLFFIDAHELWMRLIVILFIAALSVYSQINFNKVKTDEQKLKSEKEKAQKYLDIAGVIIVAINADQTVQLINQKGCELLEEEEFKIIGMNWFNNYIPENVREQVKITFNRILNGEIELLKYYENAVITKNGKKRIISWYNQALKNEAGQIIGTLSSGLDITEHKKAEQKLIESEEKFRKQNLFLNNIIESLTHPFYVINVKDYTVVLANSTAFSEGLELEQYCYSLTHNNDKPCEGSCKCPLDEVKNTKKACVVEHIHYDKEGNEKTYEIYGYPILDENGNVVQMIEYALNISDRKKAENNLRKIARQWRTTFDAMSECVLLLDLESVILQCNQITLDFLGKKDYDEIIGHSCLDIIRGPSTLEDRCPMIRMLESNKTEISIAQIGNKWCEISANPVINDEGCLIGAVQIITDITERKKAERELKESEEKYRDLFESSPISLWEEDYSELKKYIDKLKNLRINNLRSYFDENPEEVKKCVSMVKIIDINQETLELYKADKKEVFFASLNKVFTEESYNTFKEQIIKFAEGKTRFETEAINCALNGDKLFVFLVCEIVAGFKEDWSKILVSIVDISERKKAEKKLIESEEKFRTIAERALMGIIIIQDNQIKYINDALLNMLEYSQKELINWEKEDLTKLIHPEDLEFLREYRAHIRSGETSLKPYYSYRVLTKLGKVKWIDQFSKKIQYEGRSAELVTIMDITEKKEAEQELVKLNNLKSELLRRTSHELRTPLVSIKGFSDLLLELHRDKLDDYVIKTIQQIKGGCSRLESLVNDILKTAELESGTVKLKKSKEDLSLLIKVCVSELEGLSELRNHSINLEIPDELIVSFEKEQIYMVITNILINAINFTPYNGKIEVKLEINKDFIITSIMDNGIGFTEQEKTQIFKQFGKIERYGQGYDVISEGSGLGLYISKKIVELHGGKIWLESEGRNKGSNFIVSLPVDKK